MKINLLLTFDYELPLGGCESYDKGLFDPARKLLEKANALNVPLVLFADICSAIQFKNWDQDYYEKFKNQVHFALETGHDIQPHIHPHWMDSEYHEGDFKPSQRFGLSHFKDHPTISIEDIIKTSITKLKEMCLEVMPDYRCVAYRAGGYNVEPESARILSTLYEEGIKYESSVIRGLYQNFSFSQIDYRNAPDLNFWKVPITGPLTKVAEEEPFLMEYPISSIPNSVFNIIRRRFHKTLNKQEIKARRYDHSGKGYAAISKKTGLWDKVRMLMNPVVLTFDRDHLRLEDLERIVRHQVKKNKNQDEIFVTLISHPKSMGDYHLDLMERFIVRMRSEYANNLNFTSYSQVDRQ